MELGEDLLILIISICYFYYFLNVISFYAKKLAYTFLPFFPAKFTHPKFLASESQYYRITNPKKTAYYLL